MKLDELLIIADKYGANRDAVIGAFARVFNKICENCSFKNFNVEGELNDNN